MICDFWTKYFGVHYYTLESIVAGLNQRKIKMQKQEYEYVLSVENQMDLPASSFHAVLRILFQIFVLY